MPTLNGIGKEAVVNHHQQVPFHLLKDVPALACGAPGDGNLIVLGDSLVAELVRKPSAFRMQTSSDWFCPDFACWLEDGRSLVVEYKWKIVNKNKYLR